MSSATLQKNSKQAATEQHRFSRVKQTYTFRDGGFDDWLGTLVAIFGAGMLGTRLCEEAIMAGATAVVFDMDLGELSNLGNQQCQPGVAKVQSLRERCEAIRPGHLTAVCSDVRHADVRLLRKCSVWFDCTDDPNLAWPLTVLSNGLGSYLLRCAVGGSGGADMGRVLCSAGGRGCSCQCCTHNFDDIFRLRRRTPCPGEPTAERQPTLAGGAIAAGTAGLALTMAQRLIAGKDTDRILDHEFILDWTNFQLLPLRINRCEGCLTGHQKWELADLDVDAAEGTLANVFAAAEQKLGASGVDVEVYLHPLNVQASCCCGAVVSAVGSDWAEPPLCSSCSCRMRWLKEVQMERFTKEQAESWGVLGRPLAALGIPGGAMFVARANDWPVHRLLLH